ncbi:MAG: class I SAM-dependent methyltransferase [Promethearchaeota archaeon]
MKLHNIIVILRDIIYDFNVKFPNLGKPFLEGWNILHKFKFTIKKIIQEGRGQLNYNRGNFTLATILWVRPQIIDFYLSDDSVISSKSLSKLKDQWDLSKKLIKDSLIYRTLQLKVIEGKNWEEIEYYNLILSQISKGIIKWGCDSKKELDDKLREIESLYQQIKDNRDTIKENLKNENDKKVSKKLDSFGKIVVAIDRDGQFIAIEGINNLLVAKLLNIPIIPVHVKVRDKAWVDFKKKLYYFSTNYRSRRLYQRVSHPDLQDIPSTYGDIRFKIIKENLSIFKGTVLDIGANLGYFCSRFEEEGFDCYAVEINKFYIYFLTKLKKAENKKFKIIPNSIFNYKINQELHFDIVLALNIFHHFLKRKNTYFNLITLLKRLKTKELYFGAHNPIELQNTKVYRNYNPDQFVNFIIENSCLNKAQALIKLKNGRILYKLTAED